MTSAEGRMPADQPDPVLAAIERHREAREAYLKLCVDDERGLKDTTKQADAAERAAAKTVAETEPTTLQGAAELAAYMVDLADYFGREFTAPALQSLAISLGRLKRQLRNERADEAQVVDEAVALAREAVDHASDLGRSFGEVADMIQRGELRC